MSKDPRVERTEAELNELFQDQVKMLVKRCNSYYEGDHYEARDIASILRTLLHDYGGSSKSVLGQLGIKNQKKFLDSRVHNNLALASARGAWPRTLIPYAQYNDSNLFPFDEWWKNQPFQVVYRNIIFTREELVLIVANQEGGTHVSPRIHEKIAALKRTRSPWHSITEDLGDGTQSMQVFFGPGDTNESQDTGIYDFELASICAIGEELLFSLTPEPENRKRMQWEPWQKPYYLGAEEIEACKKILAADLKKIESLMDGELTHLQQALVTAAQRSLIKVLELDTLTSDDFNVREGVSGLMKQAELFWEVDEHK